MRRWRRSLLTSLILPIAALALAASALNGAAAGPRSRDETAKVQKVPVESGGAYTNVNSAGLAAMLRAKAFPLINVHIPYEGEIEGTDLFVPFDQVEANLGKLPANRNARIVLYCRSGAMSAIAARALVRHGYTDVWNLDGGMIAWEQVGYPLRHERR